MLISPTANMQFTHNDKAITNLHKRNIDNNFSTNTYNVRKCRVKRNRRCRLQTVEFCFRMLFKTVVS